MAMYDFLRMAIYLSRGVSISNTLMVSIFYNVGSMLYNIVSHKIRVKPRLMIQLATFLKFNFFVSLLYADSLIVFCLMSALLGISETISTTLSESFCYELNKEEHSKVMTYINSTSSMITIGFNIFATMTFQTFLYLPVGIIMLSQLVTFILGFKLPDVEWGAKKAKFSFKELKNIKVSGNLKKWALLLLCFKIYVIIFIRTKPYFLRSLPFEANILGHFDTAAQIGAILAAKIPRKYFKTLPAIMASNILCLIVTFLSPLINPLYMLPYLLVTPVSNIIIMPMINQEIGKESENMAQMSSVLNLVELATNVAIIGILYFMASAYKVMPFYSSYFIATPFILVVSVLVLQLVGVRLSNKELVKSN